MPGRQVTRKEGTRFAERSGRITVAVALIAVPPFAGCHQNAEPSPKLSAAPTTEVGTRQDAYSNMATMRVIPLRFVQVASSTGTSPVPAPPISSNVQMAVDRANGVFRGAGLQFAVVSVENIAVPWRGSARKASRHRARRPPH